jgi:acetylcholinesterase
LGTDERGLLGLTIDVYKPESVSTSSKLPVLVWIYGGGFQQGAASAYVLHPFFLVFGTLICRPFGNVRYDGAVIVKRSIALKEPVVFASMNYRLGGFGFLPGKEVREAGVGNLGLQDRKCISMSGTRCIS